MRSWNPELLYADSVTPSVSMDFRIGHLGVNDRCHGIVGIGHGGDGHARFELSC